MSKKLRKKSRKSPAARKASAAASKASAKRPAVKAKRSSAAKSGNSSKKQPAKARALSSKVVKSKGANKATNKAAKTAAKTSARKTAARSVLAEGEKAPAFHLPRDGGNTISLADYAGQKLVLFFYPRADTPGCTREAIDFTRLREAFAATGTAVVGVSGDSTKAQDAFRNKHQLSVPLASDEKHDMLEAYGAWGEKSMYGRTFEGILRTTVLVGADGKIIRVWRNVRVDGHADEVLSAARTA